MKIILQGIPKRKVKFDLAEKVMFLMFVILPTILLAGAAIMLVIHIFRLNYNVFVALFELVSDIFNTRTGWFFANGATFASVYKDNALEYTFRMALSAWILFMGGSIVNLQCPYCSHFFTLKRMTENGLTKALRRQWRTESCLCAAGALLPYLLRRTAACLSVRPFESNASSRIICSTVMQAYRLTLSCTASRCDISPSSFTKIFLSYHIWQVINLSFFLLLAAFLQLAM